MMQRLDDIVSQARKGADETTLDTLIRPLSTGERCYVALAADRADWLPDTYDALAAWHRLDDDWQLDVPLARMAGRMGVGQHWRQ